MTRDDVLPNEVAFLSRYGMFNRPHSGRTLLWHLRGTRRLLASWGAPPPLVAAGLFHSVYGTEGTGAGPIRLTARGDLQAVIGTSAEDLVYLFCASTKRSLLTNLDRRHQFSIVDRFSERATVLGDHILAQLFNLTVANWLEQRPHLPREMHDLDRETYVRMAPWLLPPARSALEQSYRMAAGCDVSELPDIAMGAKS